MTTERIQQAADGIQPANAISRVKPERGKPERGKRLPSPRMFGGWRMPPLLLLLTICLASHAAAQSNFEHTKDKVDQTLRSNARINPSTLAVELSIPIVDLPGRGGASMPLVFNYSSKVWELRDEGSATRNQQEARPLYSEEATAGWTTSYDAPTIDTIVEQYNCYGGALGENDPPPTNCYGANYYVKRIRVKMPGGTTHELRKDDGVYQTSDGVMDKSGTFYAVDGTRVQLEWGAGGGDTVLLMPDGGRYFFNGGVNYPQCYRYIDRHGNTLVYNSTTRAWTDTLGRTLAAPRQTNQAETTQNYAVPGLNNATRQYQFVWQKLSSGALLAGESLAYATVNCVVYNDNRSPTLFYNTTAMKPCDGTNGYFDPVVLQAIIAPNGQQYQFAYNAFGEIARIDYPTGAYERFGYAQITGLAWNYQRSYTSATSFGQANRGVVDRWVGGDGIAQERHWHYSAGYETTAVYGANTYVMRTTAPDGTSETRLINRTARPPMADNPVGNYGFDTILAGREMETQTRDANGTIRSRTLFEWQTSDGAAVGYTNSIPQRDARLKRQINLTFEPNETSALATMSETVYEVPGQNNAPTDPGYFAALNARQTKTYHYVPVSAATAPTATLATAIGWFTNATPATMSETDYLYDANYLARNINGLAIETRIRDAAGNLKAKAQISYDEATYALASSGAMPTAAANSWIDLTQSSQLGANLGSKRGLPTTVKSYSDITVDPNLYIETHSFYDQYGNARKMKDGRGNETEMQYDAANAFAYPTKTISAIPGGNGSTTAFETNVAYDYNTGLPVSTVDANNLETRMEYNDALLRPTKVQQYFGGLPIGAASETIYGAGTSAATRYVKTRAQIDETKWKEGYAWYDGLGRGIKTQSVDSRGDVFVKTIYDAVGRVSKTSNPYRGANTADSQLEWTEVQYDAAGRAYQTITPDGAAVQTAYSLATTGDTIGTAVTVTDQALKQRRSITNALGQLKRVDEPTDADGLGLINSPKQPTYYAYNPLSNLTTVQQSGTNAVQCGTNVQSCSQTRSFVYDSLSRLKSATNPESGQIQYQYDNNGNLTLKTDARGVQTTYGYDALNRVTQRNYANEPGGQTATPPVSYFYDNLPNAKGKLTKVSSSISTTEYQAFDSLGRVTGSRQTTDGATYGVPQTYVYNLSGALIEEQYPSGRIVKNVLDAQGDLAIVQSKKNAASGYFNYAKNFTYTAAGAVSSMQLGNGRWESTVFNERLQPTQIALGSTQFAPNSTTQFNADLLKLNFAYGTTANNGNVLSQTITTPSETHGTTTYPAFVATQIYSYDSLNRLKSAEETSPTQPGWKQTYLYDRFGNRNFDTGSDANGIKTTTLPLGCATAVCNPQIDPATNKLIGYAFDNAGNTKTDANGRQFIYDSENKQIVVKESNNTPVGEYYYDGDGKRVKKIGYTNGQPSETTIFVYDVGGKLVAEYANQIATTTAQVSYLTSDHLGSPRINTDQNGAVIARHDYQPFGEEVARPSYGGDAVRKQFTAYERDNETELDFAQARYYSSKLGRFYSVDPENAGASENDPQSWNGYAYGRNNPVLYSDPDGLEYKVCNNEGQCWTHDDGDFKKGQKGFPGLYEETGRDGHYDSGIIRDSDGNQIGTYERTSIDRDYQFIYGVSENSIRKGKVVLGVAAVGVVVGTSIGVAAGTVGIVGARLLAQRLAVSIFGRGQLARTISKAQTKLLGELLGKGMAGARRALASPKVSQALSNESLIIYREIAKRVISEGLDKGGQQAVRIQVIEKVLLQRGVIVP